MIVKLDNHLLCKFCGDMKTYAECHGYATKYKCNFCGYHWLVQKQTNNILNETYNIWLNNKDRASGTWRHSYFVFVDYEKEQTIVKKRVDTSTGHEYKTFSKKFKTFNSFKEVENYVKKFELLF